MLLINYVSQSIDCCPVLLAKRNRLFFNPVYFRFKATDIVIWIERIMVPDLDMYGIALVGGDVTEIGAFGTIRKGQVG